MEKRLKEKQEAMSAFVDFCKKNRPIWTHLQGFEQAYDNLSDILNLILIKQGNQEQCNTGITKDKKALKIKMADEALAISGALQAYSHDVKNVALYEKMNITHTQIAQSTDVKAISTSVLVYDTVLTINNNVIASYGINEDVIMRFRKTIDSYMVQTSAPRNAIVNKTTLTKNLHELIDQANTIMRKQLIKIGRQFKEEYPAFYNGLILNAKVIRASVHTKLRMQIRDKYTNVQVVNAKVEIEGTIAQGFTNEDGSLTLTGVIEGIKNVVIKKENYQQLILEDIHFKRGRSKTMHIKLKPEYELAKEEEAGAEVLS
ncbi:MAG: carboxypeptidase regulatory-like domain-containing protein [Bacteroidetes bacterium]|nr:carboxypeptidase regulatory-like domain-containing protein [Bacteroidota bacterium]